MGEWLKENRITTTSYPFIIAEFGLVGYDKVDKYILTSDFKEYKNNDNNTGGACTGATIEGYCPYGRSGNLSIVDPSGEWAVILTKVGSQSNAGAGGIGPNIKLTFGWRGLKRQNNETELIGQLTAYITKVEQDISAEGIFSATVHFVEYSQMQSDTIKFTEKEDMVKGLPVNLWDSVGSDKPPQDYLNYVVNYENDFSVGRVLKEKNIAYVFCDGNMTDVIKKENFIKVRFGNSLVSYIESIISLMVPNEDKLKEAENDGFIWSYEKNIITVDISDTQDSKVKKKFNDVANSEKERWTIIVYNWKKTPDINSDNVADIKGCRNLDQGPTLIWRFDGSKHDSDEDKIIIDWQSDLSSHSFLIHQYQEKLEKRMGKFDDTDWDNLLEEIEKRGIEKTQDPTKFRKALAFITGQTDRLETNTSMLEEMEEASQAETKYRNDSAHDSLRAVMLNNAFKCHATIMGDPTLGTIYPGGSVACTAFFDEGRGSSFNLAGTIFNRNYMLLKTIHKFEEGKYTTDLELLGYPDPYLHEEEKLLERARSSNVEVRGL